MSKQRRRAAITGWQLSRCDDYRVAVDTDMHGDIHGYLHVWIFCFRHVMDVSMDIFQQFRVANSKFNSELPHFADSDVIPTGIKNGTKR
jgi:hypothetical protein